MNDTLERIGELYREGELLRGIRDYILYNTEIPIHRVMRNRELTVNDTTVTIRTDRPEGVYRSTNTDEIDVLRDFERRIGPTDTVWDIGCNVGVYSLIAAADGATAIAFDPGIIPLSDAIRNAQENNLSDSIEHIPIALSDRNGTDRLSHERKHGTRHIKSKTGDIVVSLQGNELDLPNPSILKIDVEGHEYSVLQGLEDRLETVETIYLEIHGEPYIKILSLLWDNGFTITEIFEADRENQTHMRLD